MLLFSEQFNRYTNVRRMQSVEKYKHTHIQAKPFHLNRKAKEKEEKPSQAFFSLPFLLKKAKRW